MWSSLSWKGSVFAYIGVSNSLFFLLLFFLATISSTTASVLLSLSVLTVVGNSLVIITVWKDPFKNLKGTANYLILNLAVCDLLVGIPGELLFVLLHWFPHKSITRAAYTTLYLGFYASFLTILGLAVERLIIISSPLKSVDSLTSTYLALGIFCIWLFAGLLAFFPMLGWDSFHSYRMFVCDAVVFPAIILLIACYARIFVLVRKGLYRDLTTAAGGEERLSLTERGQESERLKRKERSVAFSVFILVSLFAVCWTPSIVLENITEFFGSSYVPEICQTILQALTFLHPLLNPIAYSLRTVKFRRALRKIFCNCNRDSPRRVIF